MNFIASASSIIKHKLINLRCISNLNNRKKPPWRVLFFGSDEFSVHSLAALCSEYRNCTLIDLLEVVTSTKGKPNAVRIFSKKQQLTVHNWPPKIEPGFYDVGLVVSFGHLIPESIIDKFEYGMLNVHASLLPRWRGAAPIIYALAHGDKQTGITIMQIKPRKFDIGDIISQESVEITSDMRRPELVTILGKLGASHLVETLQNLPQNVKNAKPQPTKGVTHAPRISQNFAIIDWNKMSSQDIINLDRALDGLSHVQTKWKDTPVKLMDIKTSKATLDNYKPGFVRYDKQLNLLRISCINSEELIVGKVGMLGKTPMAARDFNNGFINKENSDCRYFI